MISNRQLHHRRAMLCRYFWSSFMWWIGRWNKAHFAKIECVSKFLRQSQVTIVNRVKRTT